MSQTIKQSSVVRVRTRADKILKRRKELWAKIQREEPGMAKFIQDINQIFGKPDKTEIWVDGRKVWP